MIAINTTTSPNSALREISAPHVGPMSWMLTSVTVIPACFARSLMSASASTAPARVSVRIETVSPFTICTSASGRPLSARMPLMSSAVVSDCNG